MYVKYITWCVRIRGLARVVVHTKLYILHTCTLFYYIRESVLVQTSSNIHYVLCIVITSHQYTLAHIVKNILIFLDVHLFII